MLVQQKGIKSRQEPTYDRKLDDGSADVGQNDDVVVGRAVRDNIAGDTVHLAEAFLREWSKILDFQRFVMWLLIFQFNLFIWSNIYI